MDLLNATIPLSLKELLINFSELEDTTNQIEIALIHAVFIKTQNETMEIKDIFDSIWLKIVAIISYIVILLCSGLMLAFTEYERLYHGHFRTLINQLLSNLYVTVCKHILFFCFFLLFSAIVSIQYL